MNVTMTSPITGKRHTQEIPVTEEQFDSWKNGELIQVAMPNLTVGQREFIKTGITEEEWDAMFKED